MLTAASILRWASDLCLATATLGCFYLIVASTLTVRFRRTERRQLIAAPPITVLVPMCGAEPGLRRRLSILCRQNYPAPVQIICGSMDAADPATDIVREVSKRHPHRSIECHSDTRVYGANLKISNLINMVRHARYKTLITIDSDIDVGPDHLIKMIAELQRPGIAAVTCFYQGIAASGFWARLAALRINSDFLPNVIAGTSLSLARPCFGACIAMTRETLNRIGGFEAFANHLWDDYAIGEAVRELGYDVAIAPFAVDHVYAPDTMREWLADELRAARTIRGIEPAGHAGSIITYPFPLALIASLSYGEQAIELALVALACRIFAWLAVEHRFHVSTDNMFLLPLRDILSFAIFISSFIGASVKWRGQNYDLSRRPATATSRLRI